MVVNNIDFRSYLWSSNRYNREIYGYNWRENEIYEKKKKKLRKIIKKLKKKE
jgi:hypothetical protein